MAFDFIFLYQIQCLVLNPQIFFLFGLWTCRTKSFFNNLEVVSFRQANIRLDSMNSRGLDQILILFVLASISIPIAGTIAGRVLR